MLPTVSILIPYYKDQNTLALSVQSILDQTYTDFELFLLDHTSTDKDTINIAHSFSDPRIKHIRMEKNLGAGSGLLLLEFLKYASGKYIKLFCADDIMLPDGLETLVNFMEDNPDKDFAFGDMNYIDENGKLLDEHWFHERHEFNINNNEDDELALFSDGVGHLPFPACICKRECFADIKIEKIFILLYDMTLWTRMLLKGRKIAFINEPVCLYRISEKQLSSASKKQEAYRITSFEAIEYVKIFINEIPSIALARKCFPNALFVNSLHDGDEDFLPFVIAHYYATSRVIPWAISGRQELYKILSEEAMCKKIENKFSFGIKEFRDLYRNEKLYNLIIAPEFPNPKELKLGKLLHLLIRKLYYIGFKNLLPKKRKKKEYTI